MREKQIPVDSVECKEPIQAFAWEPVGQKFAMIHGESPSINVSFYEVSTVKMNIQNIIFIIPLYLKIIFEIFRSGYIYVFPKYTYTL